MSFRIVSLREIGYHSVIIVSSENYHKGVVYLDYHQKVPGQLWLFPWQEAP